MTVKYELGTQKDKCWKLKGTVRVPVNVSWLNLPLFVASALKLNVDSDCCWFDVALNRRVLPRDGNLLRIEALDSEIILTLSTELIESSVLIVHCDSWIFCLFISPLVPLRLCSAFGLPRLPSFSHSASLYLLHLYLSLSKTQLQKAFSLTMLVPRKEWPVLQLTGVYGLVLVPRDLHSLFCNYPVFAFFPIDSYFSRCEWVRTSPSPSSGLIYLSVQFVFDSYLCEFLLSSRHKFQLPWDLSGSGQKTPRGSQGAIKISCHLQHAI